MTVRTSSSRGSGGGGRRAGRVWRSIPAIVRNTDDLGLVERALVENLHRQDLTPLEEAAAYQQLIDDFNLTHEQVANRVGKSRSAVTNTIRLMSLPPAIQHLLADGRLSAGHARALLGYAGSRPAGAARPSGCRRELVRQDARGSGARPR